MVIFLSFISLVTNNIIIWWRIFLLITVIFIFLNKRINSFRSLINYFIIQESLGLLFLLLNFSVLQFFIILIKIGVAPLHFWIFRVTNRVFGLNLIWFLTFQKLPFLLILLQFFVLRSFLLLVLGLLVCYFQMFSLKNYKNILILSSTESFNWIIMGLFISVFNVFYLFFYYIVLMVFLINSFSKINFNFLNWETVLVFLNIPFSVTFFVKIFSLSEIFKFNEFFVVFVLFLMFVSVLTFSYWLINISTKFFSGNQFSFKTYFFIIYPLTLILIIYFSSKIYYIILIR